MIIGFKKNRLKETGKFKTAIKTINKFMNLLIIHQT